MNSIEILDPSADDHQEIARLSSFLREQIERHGRITGAALGAMASALGFDVRGRFGSSLKAFLAHHVPDAEFINTPGGDVVWGLRGVSVPGAASIENAKLAAEAARALLSPNSVAHVAVIVRPDGSFRVATKGTPTAALRDHEAVVEPVPAHVHRSCALRFSHEVEPPLGDALRDAVGQPSWYVTWRDLLIGKPEVAERYHASRMAMLRDHLRSELAHTVSPAALPAAVEFPRPSVIRRAVQTSTPAIARPAEPSTDGPRPPSTSRSNSSLSSDELRALLLRAIRVLPAEDLPKVIVPAYASVLAQITVDVLRERDANAHAH